MLTPAELKELEDRLKRLICPVCIERKADGTCALTALRECPITTHVGRLVEVTLSVKSNRMEEYVKKVREDICSICQAPSFPGNECGIRQEGHCALDAHLLPIVQMIDYYLWERSIIRITTGG